jgi:N utilization substance protein B
MYEMDICEEFSIGEEERFVILKRNITEFAPDLSDISYTQDLLSQTVNRLVTLDEIIQKAAPEWPIDKIAIVDRNVLRVGLYELLFGDRDHVPPKVAIDEAIEIAKEYGGESSGKFVNGVLGAIYKELGEPNKDQISKREPIVENMIGIVLTSTADDKKYVGLVHDIFGKWTLCKSKMQESEDESAAVTRIVKKEFGLDGAQIIEKLGENAYIAHHPEKGKVKKQVTYYLASTAHDTPTVEQGKGLDNAAWWSPSEVSGLVLYDDMRPIINHALTSIENID